MKGECIPAQLELNLHKASKANQPPSIPSVVGVDVPGFP
jgi:hypothetical protein